MQNLVQEARIKEWTIDAKFGAVKPIRRREAEELVMAGAESLPTQWLITDMNEFLRAQGKKVEPKIKARLCARADLSSIFSRSDSPTADKGAIFVVLSFSSSRGFKIKGADLDHGYFQGERLTKPLYFVNRRVDFQICQISRSSQMSIYRHRCRSTVQGMQAEDFGGRSDEH